MRGITKIQIHAEVREVIEPLAGSHATITTSVRAACFHDFEKRPEKVQNKTAFRKF
jgi:hypothetical protein